LQLNPAALSDVAEIAFAFVDAADRELALMAAAEMELALIAAALNDAAESAAALKDTAEMAAALSETADTAAQLNDTALNAAADSACALTAAADRELALIAAEDSDDAETEAAVRLPDVTMFCAPNDGAIFVPAIAAPAETSASKSRLVENAPAEVVCTTPEALSVATPNAPRMMSVPLTATRIASTPPADMLTDPCVPDPCATPAPSRRSDASLFPTP